MSKDCRKAVKVQLFVIIDLIMLLYFDKKSLHLKKSSFIFKYL